jgi:ligand-binding SRPBCC domain-containing protein
MVIDEEITIQAPLSIVWQVFSGFENWDDWTSACQMCRYQEGSEMVSGACVSFVVKPFVFPVRVAPRITRCDSGRELVWEGGRLGIYAVHTWRFRESEGKVILSSSERFRGPLLGLGRLLFLPQRLHRLTQELLMSIKEEAEGRFRGQGAP